MATETRQSGIQWIGAIPSDWNLNKIKYLATLKGRIGWQGLTSEEYSDEGAYLITGTDFENGHINWDTCVHIPMKRWEEARDIQVKNGDLLITKDGTVGKVAIVDGLDIETSLNSGVLRIITRDGYERSFLYWVLQSDVFWTWFNYKNAGNSTIIHLYQNDFAEFKYPIPPVNEQRRIAAYLTVECSKIDSIIGNMEDQVEILQRYKKSLITEAVTKGLEKDASMKDSMIEWIGLVPKEWRIRRLKYLTKIISKGATPEDISIDTDDKYCIRFIKAENIKSGIVDQMPEFYIDQWTNRQLKRSILHENDVLFVIAGATIGKVALLQEELLPANTNQAVCFIRFENNYYPRYFMYVLQSNIVSEVIQLLTVQAAQPNLSMGNIGNIAVPVPPLHVQYNIASFLDVECAKIDEISKGQQEAIEIMKQHKKSLIYEYVTGKKRAKEVDTICQ